MVRQVIVIFYRFECCWLAIKTEVEGWYWVREESLYCCRGLVKQTDRK